LKEKVLIIYYIAYSIIIGFEKSHFETSAFNGKNIGLIFQTMSKRLLEILDINDLLIMENNRGSITSLNRKHSVRSYTSSGGCCGFCSNKEVNIDSN
jgi:hypothetical protein